MMVKAARFVYLAAVWLFLVGVVVQVFLAGMVVVAVRLGWDPHIGLGHSLGAPLLVMLISMYLGRMPVKRLTWLLFGVYVLQADVVIFLRSQAPLVSALHPVLALFDFALGLALARAAWPLAKTVPTRAAVQPELEPAVEK
jgi:hypothetical protein